MEAVTFITIQQLVAELIYLDSQDLQEKKNLSVNNRYRTLAIQIRLQLMLS